MKHLNSEDLLNRLASGDDSAATALFDRYAQRLVALARKRISPALARRIDADDVAQSAFRSFFLGAREGEFVWKREGDLWSLLVTITLRKLARQAKRQRAAKRSIEREIALPSGEGEHRLTAIDHEPQPWEAIALVEQVGVALRNLSAEHRRALELRLAGHSQVEVADAMSCSQRTARRLLQQAREQLEQSLLEQDSIPQTPAPIEQPPIEPDARAPLPYHDFLLEDLIGSGGMGKVYRAVQRSLARPVAIKALRKSWHANPAAVERFLQEGRLLARLKHEHIVGFHGIGRFPAGGYFLVLDLIEGESLASRIEQGQLTLDNSRTMILQASSAVAHAHEQGVLHGDLTPANLLLDRNNDIRVTDFGFGQLLRSETTPRATALPTGGTRGFLAPELLEQNASLDERTDIYGLAAVWYAMLTGRPPVDPTLGLDCMRTAEVKPPSLIKRSVPPAIDQICLRALSRRPEDRPTDAASFMEAIATLASTAEANR